MEVIKNIIDKAYESFISNESVRERVLKARKIYFDITGPAQEEHDEYEARMHNFNEWFLFDYIPENRSSSYIVEFLNETGLGNEALKASLSNVRYSLFEYNKKAFSKKISLKDYIKDKKYQIDPAHFTAAIIPNEIFTGRLLKYDDEYFLLEGIRLLPGDIKGPLAKQAKKVKEKGNPSEERKFVLKIEKLKTKWLHYKHMDPAQIFKFD